jgi:hypothetical protein
MTDSVRARVLAEITAGKEPAIGCSVAQISPYDAGLKPGTYKGKKRRYRKQLSY